MKSSNYDCQIGAIRQIAFHSFSPGVVQPNKCANFICYQTKKTPAAGPNNGEYISLNKIMK